MVQKVWHPLGRHGIRARIAVCSDLHVCEAYASRKKMGAAFRTFFQLDPLLDAAAFVGYVTDYGTAEQYRYLMELIQENTFGRFTSAGDPTRMIFCMGNHDTFKPGTAHAAKVFQEHTCQMPVKLVRVNGIGVITLAPGGEADDDYTGCFDFLRESLQKAAAWNASAPIFVLAHHGVKNTAYLTHEWYGNYGEGTDHNLVRLMRQYPQVIHISGHSHATLEDERSIDQSLGFTTIQDGTAGAYSENETGKFDPVSGKPATVPPFGEDACEALVIDVMDSCRVTVHRLNITAGRFCGPAWKIDIPLAVQAKQSGVVFAFPYTSARTSQPPSFPPGAQAELELLPGGSAEVCFPRAFPASGDNRNMVHSYCIRLFPKNGGKPTCHRVFADFYLARQRADWRVRIPIEEFPASGCQRVEVCACTSFGTEGMPLSICLR